MNTKRYRLTLTGETPLLMHKDDVAACDAIAAWRSDPKNKKLQVKGDDRSPAFTWISYLYHDSGRLVMEADNLMSMFRDAGTKMPLPKGKGSYKQVTQSGIIVNEYAWPLLVDGAEIPSAGLLSMSGEPDFGIHQEMAQSMGFELFIKRAKVGAAKHVRVRPKFSNWSISGTIDVVAPEITRGILEMILKTGGSLIGLGDWRPGSPSKPGRFGQFSAAIQDMK